jgi:bis(5'-adenosyl)-triphosphatase
MKCPFCQPGISSFVFARSGPFMAVYNIAPVFPGHSLIIPEKHIHSLMELTDNEITAMMLFSRKITALLLRVFNAGAFDWSVQEGEVAGQSLEHLHLHIVPRFPGDLPNPGDWYPEIQNNFDKILDSASRPRLNKEEMNRIIKKLREQAREEGLF